MLDGLDAHPLPVFEYLLGAMSVFPRKTFSSVRYCISSRHNPSDVQGISGHTTESL